MEHVEKFKKELFSIYETRPPVSKTKISAITKLAIRSVKHYKHVVQIVEKMIAKCRPDYKVPGCYVIDSIVRHSRQKFGIDRDVFGPRFAKNLLTTTRNLMQCIAGDEDNIIRVLTIWQSKQLFSDDVTTSAITLAREIIEGNKVIDNSPAQGVQEEPAYTTAGHVVSSSSSWPSQLQSVNPSVPVQSFLGYGGFMPSAVTNHVTTGMGFWPQAVDVSQYAQGYVDDFDYEDDESDREHSTDIQPLNKMQTQPQMQQENSCVPSFSSAPAAQVNDNKTKQTVDKQNVQQSKPLQDGAIIGRRVISRFQKKPQALQEDDMDIDDLSEDETQATTSGDVKRDESSRDDVDNKEVSDVVAGVNHSLQWRDGMEQSGTRKRVSPPVEETHTRAKRRSRWGEQPAGMRDDVLPTETPQEWSRGASCGDDSGLFLSEGRDRDDKWDTKRDDGRYDERLLSFERRRDDKRWWDEEQREYRGHWQSEGKEDTRHGSVDEEQHGYMERQRDRHSGRTEFPVARKDTISVCSCTVWVGHLKKTVSEKQVRGLFEDYGEIQSVDMVPPRGCAYVCMEERTDAARALDEFCSRKVSIGRQPCKFAWALPKGCSSYREYWNEPMGVVYLPLNKVSGNIDLASLATGSVLDPATIPANLMEEYESMMNEKDTEHRHTPPITAPITTPISSPITAPIKPPTTEPIATPAAPPINPPMAQPIPPPNTRPMMPMMPPPMQVSMPPPPIGTPIPGPMRGPINHPPYTMMPEPVMRYGFVPFEQGFPPPWTVRQGGFLNRPRFQ